LAAEVWDPVGPVLGVVEGVEDVAGVEESGELGPRDGGALDVLALLDALALDDAELCGVLGLLTGLVGVPEGVLLGLVDGVVGPLDGELLGGLLELPPEPPTPLMETI